MVEKSLRLLQELMLEVSGGSVVPKKYQEVRSAKLPLLNATSGQNTCLSDWSNLSSLRFSQGSEVNAKSKLVQPNATDYEDDSLSFGSSSL